jgi:hypothetical protein
MLVAWAVRHQSQATQPTGQRARAWQVKARMQTAQASVQLARPPSGMTAAQLAQPQTPARCHLAWRAKRTARTVSQALATAMAETPQPLVTGGASDVKTLAEMNEGFAMGQSGKREPFPSGNQRASEPRHARSVRQAAAQKCPRCLGLALSTMSCHRAGRVRYVAHASGGRVARRLAASKPTHAL